MIVVYCCLSVAKHETHARHPMKNHQTSTAARLHDCRPCAWASERRARALPKRPLRGCKAFLMAEGAMSMFDDHQNTSKYHWFQLLKIPAHKQVWSPDTLRTLTDMMPPTILENWHGMVMAWAQGPLVPITLNLT